MTYLLKDIRDHLAGSAAVVDAVSNRIFDEVVPQGVQYPLINLSDLSAEPEMGLGGEVGVHKTQVQVDVWTDGTKGKAECNRIAELVRNRMNGYRGTFGTGCYGVSRMVRSNALAAPPIDGSDTHRRRYSMDFEITHTAAVPTLT